MTSAAAPVAASDQPTIGPIAIVLRDISRGGLAGALTGIVVAGLGGRIVMRLAAILVPESAGAFTENGNRIGDITLSGSIGLIVFGGLFFGAFGGTVWVVVSPWIPGAGLRRALVAIPIAVALIGVVLVRGDNPDFRALGHDGLVVAMLLALVAVTGGSLALVDGWLDRRLPRSNTSSGADAAYAILTLVGGLLVFPAVLLAYLAADLRLGIALVAVGIATLAWWGLRFRGRTRPPPLLLLAGRVALVFAFAFGILALAPEVADALGTA